MKKYFYFVWEFPSTEQEAGTSRDLLKQMFVPDEEVLQKLLQKRSEIIVNCHENVISLKENMLSEDQKEKAQLTYEQHAFQLDPIIIPRTKPTFTKQSQ